MVAFPEFLISDAYEALLPQIQITTLRMSSV